MWAPGRMSSRHVALAAAVALFAGAGIAANATIARLVVLTVACLVALRVLVLHLTDSYGDRFPTRRVLRWTLAAFAGHLLLSAVLNAVLFEVSDARAYHHDAVEIVRHWHGDFPLPVLPDGKEGYYYLLAGLFWLFGPHNVAGLLVNATLAAALVPIVTDLTRRLFGDDAARYVPWLVVLLPGLLLWTSQLLKEAAIVFLVAVAMNCSCRLLTRVTVFGLATLTAALALLFTMRSYVGLTLAVGLLGGIALGRPSVLGGLRAVLSAVALMALLVAGTGVGYSGYKAATSANLEQASLVRKELASSAESGFGSNLDISTPVKALASLPIAVTTFLLGPLPWQFGGARHLVALPDVLVWWSLLPSLWRGLRTGFRRLGRAMLLIVLPAMTTTALLSLTVANFGTVVRERSQVVIMLVPLVALGLAEGARRRSPGPGVGQPTAPASRFPEAVRPVPV